MKRPALQNRRVAVLRMPFGARKVSETFFPRNGPIRCLVNAICTSKNWKEIGIWSQPVYLSAFSVFFVVHWCSISSCQMALKLFRQSGRSLWVKYFRNSLDCRNWRERRKWAVVTSLLVMRRMFRMKNKTKGHVRMMRGKKRSSGWRQVRD